MGISTITLLNTIRRQTTEPTGTPPNALQIVLIIITTNGSSAVTVMFRSSNDAATRQWSEVAGYSAVTPYWKGGLLT